MSRTPLTQLYENVEDVLEEPIVCGGDTVHQPAAHPSDTGPQCHTPPSTSPTRLSPEEAVRHYDLCQRCYAPVLSHHARNPDSPVRLRGATHGDTDTSEQTGTVAADGGGSPDSDNRLASLTQEVLVGGSATSMHAPAAGGGTLCHNSPEDPRRVEAEKVKVTREPCSSCFDL